MRFLVHRGTREIGGSCVELASNGSRILLDLGMPLVERDGTPFDQKRHRDVGGPGLVERGVLPNVPGLYPWDEDQVPVQGIFISHAHLDHYGLIPFVRPDVPLYMSNDTLRLMEISEQFTGHPVPSGEIRTFEAGDRVTRGPFVVTPFLVDHSAYGAVAFLVEAEGKRVIRLQTPLRRRRQAPVLRSMQGSPRRRPRSHSRRHARHRPRVSAHGGRHRAYPSPRLACAEPIALGLVPGDMKEGGMRRKTWWLVFWFLTAVALGVQAIWLAILWGLELKLPTAIVVILVFFPGAMGWMFPLGYAYLWKDELKQADAPPDKS